jgi:hypothetical protein
VAADPLPGAGERVVALVGAFGSGKTEVAVQLALGLAGRSRAATLVDLDLVNPYFRSREAQRLLEARGVRVVVPPGEMAFADLPVVVPEVVGAFSPPPGTTTLLDVGGDDVGARVLGSLRGFLPDGHCEMWQVLNARRPATSTVEGCLASVASIERATRLRVTGLVSNAHLLEETTAEDVVAGLALSRLVAEMRGIPVRFVAAPPACAAVPAVARSGVPVLPVERRMLPPWLRAPGRTATAFAAG